MEKTIYVVAITSDENNQVNDCQVVFERDEAKVQIRNWYDNAMQEYQEDGYEPFGNCDTAGLYAWVSHNGTTEYCQGIQTVLPQC